MKKIAVLATCYHPNSHADVIVTKFLTGYPTDEGLIAPSVKIASIYFDQPERSEYGQKIAEMFGVPVYPSIWGALTLGGEELAVDGVLYSSTTSTRCSASSMPPTAWCRYTATGNWAIAGSIPSGFTTARRSWACR